MIADTGSQTSSSVSVNSYHMPLSHAYTIVNTHTVRATNGTTYNLYEIRNPWRLDDGFLGRWNDASPFWTDATQTFAAQVGFYDADDGIFWM
jgi:hypothetical protein